MSAWGVKYLPVTEELGIRAKLLTAGGPKLVARFMEELREEHPGIKRRPRRGPTVREELQAGYEEVVARKGRKRG